MSKWDSFRVDKIANGWIASPTISLGYAAMPADMVTAPTITLLAGLIDEAIRKEEQDARNSA